MSHQPNHPHAAAPEERKTSRILISLLLLSIVMSIAFFFYGLIRQPQAEENALLAQQAERMAITTREECEGLRLELEECRKE